MSKRQQYNHVRVTLKPSSPLPKTWSTPTYQLERYTIRRNVKTVNVQLHGLRGSEKRTESISFPLLANVTDAELVRAAVFFSPNKWTVHFGMNATQFNGKFSSPLSEQVLAALMGRPQADSPGIYPQADFPPYAGPTVADIPVSVPQYQPSIPRPGQFQQFAGTHNAPRSPGNYRRTIWQWYKTRTRRMKISLGCGTIIAVLLFFSCIGSAIGRSNLAPPPTPTQTAGQAVITGDTPTPLPTPTQQVPTPNPTLTPRPTVRLTPTGIVRPTPTPIPPRPTPTPSCQAVNNNPWCYNFSPGNYITSPPSNFCDYFACIASFWDGHGYVEECQDATYSLSGGIHGSCSHHGGDLRPLYSH
jgi:hypothetical protein